MRKCIFRIDCPSRMLNKCFAGVPRHSQSPRDTSSFVFTLTEKDSAKIRHGICLNFFQNYERNRCASTDDTNNLHNNRPRRRLEHLFKQDFISKIQFFPKANIYIFITCMA